MRQWRFKFHSPAEYMSHTLQVHRAYASIPRYCKWRTTVSYARGTRNLGSQPTSYGLTQPNAVARMTTAEGERKRLPASLRAVNTVPTGTFEQ